MAAKLKVRLRLYLLIAPLVLTCTTAYTAPAKLQRHPVSLAQNTDPSTCLQCHADKDQGKYVHTAMQMGCTACHAIKNIAGGTSVTLISPADQLCFTCHQKSSDPVQHQPYSEGACTICHSPHASNFPAHTWVAHQELCMGCHVKGMLKVNRAKKTVTVPWGRSLAFKQMDRWYYLGLDATHTKNHPVEGHPVSGPNPLVPGSPDITCLTCHTAHTSTVPNLVPPKYPQQEMLCVSCHNLLTS